MTETPSSDELQPVASSAADDIVVVKDLEKRYGHMKAVDGISFTVRRSEIFALAGPNGAGKTSTLEMLETLRSIDGGTATIAGIDVATQPYEIRKIIGVQLQAAAFQDKVTLAESLRMFAAFYGKRIDVAQLLAEVGLNEKARSYPEQLSGGQRQRFSVAVALVNEPQVLFLDEVTTGLDPQARRNMWDLIRSISQRGITIVLTSHYMEEVETLADQLAILDEGKLIALDTPQAMIEQLIGRGFKREAVIQPANLEDVYIDLTGKELRDE